MIEPDELEAMVEMCSECPSAGGGSEEWVHHRAGRVHSKQRLFSHGSKDSKNERTIGQRKTVAKAVFQRVWSVKEATRRLMGSSKECTVGELG
jgi:hypothetical protein